MTTLVPLTLPIGVTITLPWQGIVALSLLGPDTHPLEYRGAFDAIGMAEQVEAYEKACDALDAELERQDGEGMREDPASVARAANLTEAMRVAHAPLQAVITAAAAALEKMRTEALSVG